MSSYQTTEMQYLDNAMLVPFHQITLVLIFLSLFKSSLVIVDPTAEEEDLAAGALTIVTDEEGNLCSVYKPGTVSYGRMGTHSYGSLVNILISTLPLKILLYISSCFVRNSAQYWFNCLCI